MSEDIFHNNILVTLIDPKLWYVLLRDRKVGFSDLTDGLFFSSTAIDLTTPDSHHSIFIVTLANVFYDLDRCGCVTLTVV